MCVILKKGSYQQKVLSFISFADFVKTEKARSNSKIKIEVWRAYIFQTFTILFKVCAPIY